MLAQAPPAPSVATQPTAPPTPKFEVASIKACPADAPGGRGGRKAGDGPSPDRLNQNCQTVKNLIQSAYISYANAHFNFMDSMPIEGGPAWINSDRYQINAKAEGTPGNEIMRGPMMQALLEDRFKVKLHREIREVPVYALTVAKSGPKLQPFQAGSCFVLDFTKPPQPDTKPICVMRGLRFNGTNAAWEVHGSSLDEFSKALGADLDRPVINKTGIAGVFDFHLEFAPDETTSGLPQRRGNPGDAPPAAAPDPAGGPSIFTAIQQQLGLKLESAKGPREFLVIDRVEKPSEN
jgi:uncharacterized protein (TIGR03435 family)